MWKIIRENLLNIHITNEVIQMNEREMEAMTHWFAMSRGYCYSCHHDQMDSDHAIDEKGNCACDGTGELR